jgi:hypothetical protein
MDKDDENWSLLFNGTRNGIGKRNTVMREPPEPLKRRDAISPDILFAALRARPSTWSDSVGSKPPASRRTCGFRERRWSPMPAALHRALTHMSYCRDGHREPPDP